MSTRTITHVKRFTKAISLGLVLAAANAGAEWSVDFSRRVQPTEPTAWRAPASAGDEMPIDADQPASPTAAAAVPVNAKPPGFFEQILSPGDIAQEIVVLNTEKGFVPSTLRVKKGLAYEIHVVNVNDKEKNVSFVLDSFSEHHATYYGRVKTFTIRPQKEGVYRFVSPETSAQGKLVVYPAANDTRVPASAE